ncbi:hypothetical protein EBU58_04935 [bacterium]|nr:hypothetical protein [bacterium]
MSRIKLVQGDSLPYIKLTLTDPATGLPINVADADVVVRVYFRAAGSATVLSTITCEKVDGGATGIVRFNFANGELDVEPGAYEGEVELDFEGQVQTVYDVLKFNVRSQFA